VKKRWMTKMRVNDSFVSVTLVQVIPQEIVRFKTEEKDGYTSLVLWIEKKAKSTKGKLPYKKVTEFYIDESFIQTHKTGEVLDISLLKWIESIEVVGTSKGKGFQGVMKRFHAKWWPKTHGSKFHRQIGSLGNRKPRRVQKWHPHAGRMGWDQTTLKNIKILDLASGDEQIVALKWSLPWANNEYLKLVIV